MSRTCRWFDSLLQSRSTKFVASVAARTSSTYATSPPRRSQASFIAPSSGTATARATQVEHMSAALPTYGALAEHDNSRTILAHGLEETQKRHSCRSRSRVGTAQCKRHGNVSVAPVAPSMERCRGARGPRPPGRARCAHHASHYEYDPGGNGRRFYAPSTQPRRRPARQHRPMGCLPKRRVRRTIGSLHRVTRGRGVPQPVRQRVSDNRSRRRALHTIIARQAKRRAATRRARAVDMRPCAVLG